MLFQTSNGPIDVTIDHLFIAGWTGRDVVAVQHHIDELAAIGVPAPSKTPLFYRVAQSLLTQSDRVQVLGDTSSGEVEPLIVKTGGKLWLGLGSDHTDRALETVSVAASKQVCAKPVATELWDFDDVADRLDDLGLRSWVWEGSEWQLYQDGSLAKILPLADIIAGADLPDNAAMLCGTLGAIGGVRSSAQIKCELSDPVQDRRITLIYTSDPLPHIS